MLPPTIFVIFGITGDLSQRYVMPALAAIEKAGQLPKGFKIIGVSRRDIKPADVLNKETRRLGKYLQILKVDMANPRDYKNLKSVLAETGKKFKTRPQIMLYLLIPPEAVPNVVEHLRKASLNGRAVKLLLEKPFGVDLKSAERLISQTSRSFHESQIYRIDHYLAKEVAQNIAVFLGSNALFRGVWNNQFIEKIEIVVAEKEGVGARQFYDQTGALRDMIQSHLLQLAALTLMEPCSDPFDLDEIARRRLAALKDIKPVAASDPKKVLAAQYEGYQDEIGNLESDTETFVDLILYSKNNRWKKVPVELVTGKKLNEKLSEIRVHFKKWHAAQANLLILRIQPRESIELDLWIKQPGYVRKLQRVSHRLDYDYHFGRLPGAYEQVLIDAMFGSHGLFASSEEVLASWRILEPILKHWSKNGKRLFSYKPGSTVEEVLVADQ